MYLEIKDMKKSFGSGESYNQVLKGITTNIEQGQMCVIQGSSGSGKSTLIKLLMKELDSTSGQMIVSGERLEKMKHRRVAKYRRKLGVVFQDFRLLKDRNVYENVAFAQRVIGRPTRVIRRRVPEVLQEVGLAEKYKSFPDELSGGEQQMLAMGRALMSKPRLIVMDEPSMGLSPIFVNEIFDIIRVVSESGTTVLLVEQNAKKALSIADRAYVLETGKITMSGNASDLLNDEAVQKAYLGE